MTGEGKFSLFSFKNLLCLVAVIFATAAAVLMIWLTSAATVTGGSPAAAIALVAGPNTGVLGPGEQRWFRFRPDPTGGLEQTLTLVFTRNPAQPGLPVTFQLFDETQLHFFYQSDASRMTNLGAGQVVDRDNKPETGELLWTGWLSGQQNYYIQVMNGSQSVVDYWLFNRDVAPVDLNPPAVPAPAPAFASGAAPFTALQLSPGENRGGLEPGQEVWYRLSVTDTDREKFEPVALTMVTTPDDGQRIASVTFDIFSPDAVKNWSPGGSGSMNNIGAGSIVYRDNNPWTGERFWAGWLLEDGIYYISVRNGTAVHMDYWLFPGDVYNHPLGETTQVAP